MKRRIITLAATLMVLCATGWTQATLAHSSVTQSNPPNGATVTTQPQTLDMAFEQPVRLTLVTLTRDAEGAFSFFKSGTEVPVSLESGGMSNVYSIDLPELANGDYTVEWRALANDGHAISGHVHFTVAVE